MAGPQQRLHFGGRQFTPAAYVAAREAGELGAVVHSDGSKTLLSGERVPGRIVHPDGSVTILPMDGVNPGPKIILQEPTVSSILDAHAQNIIEEETSELIEDIDSSQLSEEAAPAFTFDELKAKAKEAGIKGYHLCSYETLLEKLYPQQ